VRVVEEMERDLPVRGEIFQGPFVARRVQFVRRDGRDVSTLYGREGAGEAAERSFRGLSGGA